MSHINLVPVITTAEGSCLTAQNWQETGVEQVCYYLDALLVKPGFTYLTQLPDWEKYTGWQGRWVLNAVMPLPNKEGNYVFRSPYDGSRVSCSMQDIVQVILHLKPQQVILPVGFEVDSDAIWQALLSVAELYIPENERTRYSDRQVTGIYYIVEQGRDVVELITKHPSDLASYLVCKTALLPLAPLVSGRQVTIESDAPAKEACYGVVYNAQGVINLRDSCYALQFECIDANCACPTCTQQFTRAYLHHLLEHTPLLCQRLLIQHNVHYCLNNA